MPSAIRVGAPGVEFVDIAWRGRVVRIEHQWVARDRHRAPLLVFLHEGLGSLSTWKDFPTRLCAALGCRGLIYSRPGYGRSTPRRADEAWARDFMHQQAQELLPALLLALGLQAEHDKPWLYGHSDGGSIALLYAAARPQEVAGVVVAAPHILVEALTLASITQAREAYRHTDLRQRLARHHDDPDSAFWGWCDIWLHPAFGSWSIERDISAISCPLLAVQGLDDEYGTLAQIHRLRGLVPQTQTLELAACGHVPHRDQRETLIEAVRGFFLSHTRKP